MIRSRFRSRMLIFLALATVSLALGLVPGCGYVLTYDDAFPPQPLDFPRWDPPDSIAFLPVSPPPVEAVILDALDQLMVGRTSFMIAHRLSTIHHADQILVLDNGRLVQQGTHESLLTSDGLYRQLHDVQTKQKRRMPQGVIS